MNDVVVYLISKQFEFDAVGNQIIQDIKTEVPIIEFQDVYQSEFYNARQQGLKPSLRIVISNLNYNDEEELEYKNQIYTIIRVDTIDYENIALVCEKRVGANGQNNTD